MIIYSMHPSVFLTADPIQGYEERCSLSRVSRGERDRLPVYHQTNITHLKKTEKQEPNDWLFPLHYLHRAFRLIHHH